MKKDLNIMEQGGKPMVIEPEATIDLDEVNPLDENVKMYSSSAWMRSATDASHLKVAAKNGRSGLK